MRNLLRGFFFFFLILTITSSALFAEEDSLLLKKSKILMTKGIKAEQKGEIDEAVAAFEEAYSVYPKNFFPLLLWGKSLAKVGMYERAGEILNKIPLEKLSKAGKSEVHCLLGKIALSKDSVESAAYSYSQALKVDKDNGIARVRLAVVNQLLNIPSRAEELLLEVEDFEGFPMKELLMASLLDMRHGNFGRALSTIEEFPEHMEAENYFDEEEPVLISLWRTPSICFLAILPIGLKGLLSFIYFGAVLMGLVLLASRLSPQTSFWHDCAFVIGALVLVIGTQHFAAKSVLTSTLLDEFSITDSIWVMPRLLIGMNFISLGLFIVFPMFKFMPESQRPKRYEFYGIWFFCWWFITLVLVFQSNLQFSSKALYMSISFILSLISASFMPLGRFLFYRVASVFGFGGVANVASKDLRTKSSISFTDAKILETKAWQLIAKEDFEEVILTGRKVLNSLDKKTFPSLWKAMIFAFIAKEDYFAAEKWISDFKVSFTNSNLLESGLLFDAYLKSLKGDFATAIKIIKGMPNDRIKSFSNDETSIILLTLGRCNLAYKENVQAHIDLNKAYECARLPLMKIEALIELMDLDIRMKAASSVKKWQANGTKVSGGPKTLALKKTLASMAVSFENKTDEALNLAKEGCLAMKINSRACLWYGHLLCQQNNHTEAEEILNRMTVGTADANKLMEEVTGAV
jgi:tetratricopeptide (TPR) repeat protein